MTKLPSTIKVGAFVYSVEEFSPGVADASDLYGHVNHSTQIIQIDTSKPPERVADTFLHEILHCIYRVWNLPDELQEEDYVVATSYGLTTVFRDNPELLPWLTKMLK